MSEFDTSDKSIIFFYSDWLNHYNFLYFFDCRILWLKCQILIMQNWKIARFFFHGDIDGYASVAFILSSSLDSCFRHLKKKLFPVKSLFQLLFYLLCDWWNLLIFSLGYHAIGKTHDRPDEEEDVIDLILKLNCWTN